MVPSKIYIICLIITLTPSSLFANTADEKLAVAVLYSEKFLMQDTVPGHPESPERLSSVINTIKTKYNAPSYSLGYYKKS